MDLLGGYNSDSDSDESSNAPPVVAAAPAKPKPLPKVETKADKKKRVMGKKLLKLSSVLPEHILNQLQQSGGGGSKSKNDSDDDDDNDSDSDSSSDEKPRRKTTPQTAAAPRDYSQDKGLMGLLSELSKSNSSSRKPSSMKILGKTDPFVAPVEEDSSTIPESSKEAPTPKSVTPSEPLGAAFLTTTVETVVRKRKEPAAVRSIHGDSTVSSATTSVHAPRPPISTTVPQPRVQMSSSLRSAAPVVRRPMYAAEAARQAPQHHPQPQQPRGQPPPPPQKKKLSRKRQMEQMLRAGKLDQVEGDHQLSGVSHVYNLEGDMHQPAPTHSSSAGVRVVPTGRYDPSAGANAMTTDVTSRQKNTNQLNSLLANAASLESHRAQNPQYHLMPKKGGSHRATAKRKYGW